MIDDDIKRKKKHVCECFWVAHALMFHGMHDPDEDQLSHPNSGKAIQRFGF
jgi:hypothetical protein